MEPAAALKDGGFALCDWLFYWAGLGVDRITPSRAAGPRGAKHSLISETLQFQRVTKTEDKGRRCASGQKYVVISLKKVTLFMSDSSGGCQGCSFLTIPVDLHLVKKRLKMLSKKPISTPFQQKSH